MKMYIVLALTLAAVLPVAEAQTEMSVPAVPAPVVSVAPCPSPAAVRKAAVKKAAPTAKAALPWWQNAEKVNLAVLLLAVFLLGIIVGRLFAPRQPQVLAPIVYVPHPHPPPPPHQPVQP